MKSLPGVISLPHNAVRRHPRPGAGHPRPYKKTWMAGTSPAMTKMNALRKSSDRLMDGDKLGAVGKRRLDLDVVDHFSNARHHLSPGKHLRAGLHQLGDGAAI